MKLFLQIILTCFVLTCSSANLLNFLPQDSKIVIWGDVGQLNRFFECSSLFNSSFRLQELASQAVLTMSGLDQDCYMLFCKTPLKEAEFAEMLQKKGKVLTVSQEKNGQYLTRKLSVILPDKMVRQSIYVTFLASDIVLLSNENVQLYLKQKTGLSSTQKQFFSSDKILCGYIFPDRAATSFYPAASQVNKVLFDAVLLKNDVLGLSIRMTPAQNGNPEQLNMQTQQIVLLLGMMLNSFDPNLSQEFTRSVSVSNDKETVVIRGNFTRAFIEKFVGVLNLLINPAVPSQQGTNQVSPAAMRKER